MNLQDIVERVPTMPPHSQGSKVSRGETWDFCKERIYDVYIKDRNTLPSTMKFFESEYGLKACTRTWKSKLKEWKYDKYCTDKFKSTMIFDEKERSVYETDVTVFQTDPEIRPTRENKNQKRKLSRENENLSSRAVTPRSLTYDTTPMKKDNSIVQVLGARLLDQAQALAGTPQPELSNNECAVTRLGMQLDAAWSPYKASLARFLTVRNDCSLFFAARSAGLVRISVKGLRDGFQGIDMVDELLGKALWVRLGHSEIYPWCDSCLKIIGADIMYECKMCPPLHDKMFPSFCRTCYSNKEPACLAQGHKIQRNIVSVPSECLIAENPEEERWCDAFICGKKISGLYFHCCACKDDGFCICLQCAMGGRGCRDLKHDLSAGVRPI